MDLFDLNDQFSANADTMLSDDKNVIIWQKKVKGTLNTYVYWQKDYDTLKGYHKTLKKKWGCHGSLKKNQVFGRVYDNSGIVDKASGRNVSEIVFHLSKDCVKEMVDFIKSTGVNESNIEVKVV